MRGVAAMVAVGLLLALSPAAIAVGHVAPRLTLAVSSPVAVVRGTSFKPRERVTLRLTGTTVRTKIVIANASGYFRATLTKPIALSCGRFVLVAVGAKGSVAITRTGPLECNPPGD